MPGPNPLLFVFYVSMMVIATTHASDNLDDPDVNRTTVEITIEHRKIKGDKNVFRVYQGEHIELLIVSDETVSLHFHGYDIEFKVNPEAGHRAIHCLRNRPLPGEQPWLG
ncbi:MAG: hypothetical protein IIA76_07115 [Proteobacteria bacterium]|nr:hypothetical protein [Pseudomonadota bacterium]